MPYNSSKGPFAFNNLNHSFCRHNCSQKVFFFLRKVSMNKKRRCISVYAKCGPAVDLLCYLKVLLGLHMLPLKHTSFVSYLFFEERLLYFMFCTVCLKAVMCISSSFYVFVHEWMFTLMSKQRFMLYIF